MLDSSQQSGFDSGLSNVRSYPGFLLKMLSCTPRMIKATGPSVVVSLTCDHGRVDQVEMCCVRAIVCIAVRSTPQQVWLGVWNVHSMITAHCSRQTYKHTRTFFTSLEVVSCPPEKAVADEESHITNMIITDISQS